LSYLRTKESREVDFALTEGERVSVLIEAKTSESEPSPSLLYFKERIDGINAVQLVWNLRKETHRRGVDIVRAADWLSRLEA
jgi:predicted AAA+ superfamily ATPase